MFQVTNYKVQIQVTKYNAFNQNTYEQTKISTSLFTVNFSLFPLLLCRKSSKESYHLASYTHAMGGFYHKHHPFDDAR